MFAAKPAGKSTRNVSKIEKIDSFLTIVVSPLLLLQKGSIGDI